MRKIFAHAHEWRPGDVCAEPKPRKMKKISKKIFFSQKSKNIRACARVAPGGRVRRAQTAEDGKFSKKKFFPKSRKILAHAHEWCPGTCAQGPDRGSLSKINILVNINI